MSVTTNINGVKKYHYANRVIREYKNDYEFNKNRALTRKERRKLKRRLRKKINSSNSNDY